MFSGAKTPQYIGYIGASFAINDPQIETQYNKYSFDAW